ncbi:MAG: ABC transporter permease [Devosia sp.]
MAELSLPAAAAATGRRKFPIFGLLTSINVLRVVGLIVYPAGLMLTRVFIPNGVFDLSAFAQVLSAPWLWPTLMNTVLVVLAGGFCAILTASIFAWLNERTDARLGLLGDILPIIPLLVPAVAMAIGWIFLATPGAGFINGFLSATLGKLGVPLQVNITSWPGLIFIYTIYFVPYVYIMVAAAFRNVDPALEEASRLSGASTWMTLTQVSLPAIAPALLGAALLTVIVGFSVYSIPVVIANRANIDILSVRILRSLTFEYPPRTAQAIVLTLFMLAAIVSVWLIQKRVTSRGNFATIGGKSARHVIVQLGPWKWLARAVMILFLLATSVLPLLALLIVAVQPFWMPAINPALFTLDNFYSALIERPLTRVGFLNSIGLGIVGGFIGILLGAVIALYVRNATGTGGRIVDAVTKLPAALSHIVIAVGILLAFSGPPLNLSGTLIILMMTYIVIHMPEASIAANAAVAQVGKELLEASSTSGASEGRTFREVLIPLTLPGMVSGWALLFVLMAGELTASALLAGSRNPVIGFVILDIWEQGTFGTLAALAFTFTIITSSIVLVVTALSRRRTPR